LFTGHGAICSDAQRAGAHDRPHPPTARGPRATGPDKTAALCKAAQALEASFLAEMLKFAGTDKPPESFGGGIGEEQFGSFLRQAEADAMVRNGGVGLAEKLFEALKERADGSG
jgi:Rod binding domain-containing protein